MFDELHDPNPPQPSLREFAIVAERARDIRRRRATWATRLASVVLVLGAGLAMYQVSTRSDSNSNGPAVTADPATPSTLTPSTPAPSTPAPSTQPSEVPATLSLDAAQSASALPRIDLGPGLLTVSGSPLVEIFESTDGRTCVQADVPVSTPACAPSGAGFFVIQYGEGDAARVAFVVDPTVHVTIDAANDACSQSFPDFAVVQVWVCSGLDLDAATIEFPGPDQIVVRP